MNSFNNSLNDSFNDTLGSVLHELKQKYNVPAFVKQANQADICPPEDTEGLFRVCGDPENLRYPCHTKAAAWVSAAYFADAFDSLPEDYRKQVGDRILKFANFFDILPEVQELIQEKTRTVKEASADPEYPDDWYLAVTQEPDGHIKKAGLLHDADSISRASEWLLSHRNELPLHTCCDAAVRLVKRAQALHTRIPNYQRIEKLLGQGSNEPSLIAFALEKRASRGFTRNKELSNTLFKIAESIRQKPQDLSGKALFKLACFLDECDHRMNFIAERSRGEFQMPEDVCYHNTVSQAKQASANQVKLQNGKTYTLDALAGLDRGDFQAQFGSELTDECFTGLRLNAEASANILPTLPRPMADQLSTLIDEKPVRQEKAASSLVLPSEFFR